ncbi:MAG: hypothetical protein C0626_05880 [Arcobacter sp.]|uniref:hypothetical protein n=1 Tax=uncultured Arcobacter sp. TaxID=165434 RepID=UPI000CA683D1|nr:hypothetical protein [uncultured Arcobacter sp.]PLY10503.1 MAG: hypothetical protein C0626_05880 [Arcobacter sp.]
MIVIIAPGLLNYIGFFLRFFFYFPKNKLRIYEIDPSEQKIIRIVLIKFFTNIYTIPNNINFSSYSKIFFKSYSESKIMETILIDYLELAYKELTKEEKSFLLKNMMINYIFYYYFCLKSVIKYNEEDKNYFEKVIFMSSLPKKVAFELICKLVKKEQYQKIQCISSDFQVLNIFLFFSFFINLIKNIRFKTKKLEKIKIIRDINIAKSVNYLENGITFPLKKSNVNEITFYCKMSDFNLFHQNGYILEKEIEAVTKLDFKVIYEKELKIHYSFFSYFKLNLKSLLFSPSFMLSRIIFEISNLKLSYITLLSNYEVDNILFSTHTNGIGSPFIHDSIIYTAIKVLNKNTKLTAYQTRAYYVDCCEYDYMYCDHMIYWSKYWKNSITTSEYSNIGKISYFNDSINLNKTMLYKNDNLSKLKVIVFPVEIGDNSYIGKKDMKRFVIDIIDTITELNGEVNIKPKYESEKKFFEEIVINHVTNQENIKVLDGGLLLEHDILSNKNLAITIGYTSSGFEVLFRGINSIYYDIKDFQVKNIDNIDNFTVNNKINLKLLILKIQKDEKFRRKIWEKQVKTVGFALLPRLDSTIDYEKGFELK